MADLLKMLSYLEGELQAREVVIATLKVSSIFEFFSSKLSIAPFL